MSPWRVVVAAGPARGGDCAVADRKRGYPRSAGGRKV